MCVCVCEVCVCVCVTVCVSVCVSVSATVRERERECVCVCQCHVCACQCQRVGQTPNTGLRHPSGFNHCHTSYAIGSRKLSANEQFFQCWFSNSSKFVTNNSNYIRRLFYN